MILARKLQPYFQVHSVTLLIDQPMKAILYLPYTLGRIAKWVLVLSKFDVGFYPRPSIKAQVLTDFVLECKILEEDKSQMEGTSSQVDLKEWWSLHVDGSSSSFGLGVGLILAPLEGDVVDYALWFDFPTTNNKIEYEVLIIGLKITKELGVQYLIAFSDSQLVAG